LRYFIKKHGRCAKCNSTKNLTIHHINRDNKDNRIDNLQCLCVFCHSRCHDGMYVTKTLTENYDKVTMGSLFDWDFLLSKKTKG
jgi:5-methylcytosine-specific restriction endonuclease McrA